uniref:redoxin domain-containing protein n=1 Tax=Alistipes sp. TaxID=1872444 RepID=UPI00405651AA
MKKILLAMMAIAAFVGCTNKQYTVSGTLTPDEEFKMTNLYADEDEGVTFTTDAEGHFSLSGDVESPYYAEISSNAPESEVMMRFFVEPGKIAIEMGEDGQPIATGTPSNDGINRFNEDMMAAMVALYSAQSEEEAEAAYARRDSVMQATITNNKNALGAFILAQVYYQWEDDEVKQMIEAFPVELQQSKPITAILELFAQKAKTEIGQPYMELELSDKEGNPVKLSSLIGEGKWVLVDFWATWCEPCKAEIPALKEAYAAYHDKGFEIYGVSLDQDPEAWKSYITEHEMNWVNTLGRDGNPASAEMIDQYAVQSIPSNFLIGPDGKIVARHLRGEAVMQTLSEQIK